MQVVATATAVIFLTAVTAAAQTGRGAVTSLSTEPGVGTGMVRFIVRGQNPCGAVHLQFGDGTDNVTYPIRELPWSVEREYTRTGQFQVRAIGMGNCDGEAVASARVTSVRPQSAATPPAAPPAERQAGARNQPQNIRFAEMDRNRDGVISRQEWRGSQRSFEVHDWNGDGRLAGDEVRQGANWPNRNQGQGTQNTAFWDWSEAQFRQLDRNADNRISRIEWARYDIEDFIRADQNGDNVLTMREFMLGDVDDDRGDRFAYLDMNNNNRIDRTEWHGGEPAFRWLDRNGDGQLSRTEVAGTDLDASTGGGGNRSAGDRPAGVREPARNVIVNARQQWVDTGIDLRAGDFLYVSATGRASWAPNAPYTDPNGTGSAPANYPVPGAGEGSLIGRIGNTQAFMVGANLDSHRANAAGRLYLMVNDDMVTDNRGSFNAAVIVERRR